MRWLLVLAVLAGAAWWFLLRQPRAEWHGTPAPSAPVQVDAVAEPFVQRDPWLLKPVAAYKVKAVVLSRRRYARGTPEDELAPLDLALGWGPMSEARVVNALDVNQWERWYTTEWSGPPSLAPRVMSLTSANTHCIPATPELRDALLAVERHDLVTLEGFLVEASALGGATWKSSMTREDFGSKGASELLYVTRVDRRRP